MLRYEASVRELCKVDYARRKIDPSFLRMTVVQHINHYPDEKTSIYHPVTITMHCCLQSKTQQNISV
jgi:hypothetical protein